MTASPMVVSAITGDVVQPRGKVMRNCGVTVLRAVRHWWPTAHGPVQGAARARHGRMRVELDLKRLDSFGARVHSAVDRATIGIMTASLVVGPSIVMTVAGGPTLFGVSLLTYCGFAGYLVAFVNSLWIILSIWRSGRR